MALIKYRPAIKLYTPARLIAGKPFDAAVVLSARRPVPVESVDVELDGQEERVLGNGSSQIRRIRRICLARAQVVREAELPAGPSTFRARFSVPENAPPSYAGAHVSVRYVVHVRVTIPWWPDAQASFELDIAPPPRPHPPRSQALIFSSRSEGPAEDEPHVECSLSADVITAGSVLSGAVALNNVAYARYTGLRLALVGTERVSVSNRNTAFEAHRYEVYLPVDDPAEGEQREFRMRLPRHVPASHVSDTRTWLLAWELECRAEVRWGRDLALRVPITVLPFDERAGAVESARARRAPPTVGSERVQAAWRLVGRERGLTFDGRSLRGATHGCQIVIEREHRGGKGVYLVGRLTYASLQLGLSIEPARGFRLAGHKGVRLGDGPWHRRHHVTCRDPSQLRALADHMTVLFTAFKSVRMTDRELAVELESAGATATKLDSFVLALFAAARCVWQLPDHTPPPEAMRDGKDAWSALATSMEGALETARMAVSGVVQGVPAHVWTEWSPAGEAVCTRLEVRAPMVIDPAVCGTYAGLGEPPAVAAPDVPSIRTLGDSPVIERLAERAWLIEIAAESVTATLPAPITDPRALEPILAAMVEWARSAAGDAGPYR